MPTSTAIRMLQLNGKRTRRNSVGAMAEMVTAHIELMIDENRNEMPMISAAFASGVCSVTPLNAKPTVNAAAALIAVIRAQNLREQIIARYCWSFVGGLVVATSTSPGTFTVEGAKRPPSARPPGSGA